MAGRISGEEGVVCGVSGGKDVGGRMWVLGRCVGGNSDEGVAQLNRVWAVVGDPRGPGWGRG